MEERVLLISMGMRAARLHAYGKPFVLEELPEPTPGPGQVVIRVKGAGFCHSDLHVSSGELPILPKLPVTLGHENAGVVSAIGVGVTHVREGDRVAVFGGWGCGYCAYCDGGEEQLCMTPTWAGLSQYDGGYAEYLLVPHERHVVKLDKLSPVDAAPLTDAALTPYRAVKKARPFLDADTTAMVIGLGALGQYGLKLLRILTGCPVIVVDTSEDKRKLARKLGAAHVLDGNDPEIATKIRDLTRGLGVGTAFDFVGSESTLALAVATTRSLGKVSQIGLAGGTAHLKVMQNSRFEVMFEATLWGTVRELREVVSLAERGVLDPIDTEIFPLEKIEEVRARLQRGEIRGRAVIAP